MTSQRRTLVAAILGLGVTTLDETVVFVALPAMERDLGFGLLGQQWIVNAYLLPLAALLLLGGSLGDRYGRRRLFRTGLLTFGGASLAAGLAPAAAALFAARAVQGIGAAMLMPATLALVTSTFADEERGGAIGSWAAWGGAAAAIGPLVAGVAIDVLSWRWIFVLPIPLVAAALALSRGIEESRDERVEGQPLDVWGAALAAVALGALSFVVLQGPTTGWTSLSLSTGIVIAVAGLAGFLVRERRATQPLLPLELFASRNFSAGNATTLAIYAVFNGNFFILSIYLQTVLDYSALQAGAATLPVTLLMIALSSRIGRASQRIGVRAPMTAGPVVAAVGLAWLAYLEPTDPYWTGVLPGVVLFGVGLATTVAPLTTAVMTAVPEHRAGVASGANNDVARTGGLIGVALMGLAFGVTFRAHLPPAGPEGRPDNQVVASARDRPTSALEGLPADGPDDVVADLRAASVSGYRTAMAAGAALATIGGLIAFAGVRNRPDDSDT